MQTGARLQAAAEVLEDILVRHRPTALALADWGKAHRFAGWGDRNAIGGIVCAALRRRAWIAWAMGDETPRALAIGAGALALALPPQAIAAACDGARHAPSALSEAEAAGLARPLDGAPARRADVSLTPRRGGLRARARAGRGLRLRGACDA